MIRAWRRLDGRYRLDFIKQEGPPAIMQRWLRHQKAEFRGGKWVVPGSALEPLGAEKMYGVVTGPSSCGCEPATFRWVTEGEVGRGVAVSLMCPACNWGAEPPGRKIYMHCDILDVCGEGDEALATYDAEFRHKVEAFA